MHFVNNKFLSAPDIISHANHSLTLSYNITCFHFYLYFDHLYLSPLCVKTLYTTKRPKLRIFLSSKTWFISHLTPFKTNFISQHFRINLVGNNCIQKLILSVTKIISHAKKSLTLSQIISWFLLYIIFLIDICYFYGSRPDIAMWWKFRK